jgi:hypothetical protein
MTMATDGKIQVVFSLDTTGNRKSVGKTRFLYEVEDWSATS